MVTRTAPKLAEGARLAAAGVFVNALLAIIKGVAGILGNSYALIADAVESVADIAGSLVVWGSLRLSARSADDDHPYGHGKAEPLAAAVVGLMLCGAALGIAVKAVDQIRDPHHAPKPYTLLVLIGVMVVKELLARRVLRVASDVESQAVHADAWHHRADAITSGAAFIGISAALLGGVGYEWCDAAAAMLASAVIGVNAAFILRPAVHELMDGAPDTSLLQKVAIAAEAVEGVQMIEKLKARKVGTRYFVDLHVQADPAMPLHDSHILSGCVKTAIRLAVPSVENVLVHMEPFEPE
ncbi:MAG: cation diffusion facilitator family transporter [Gemmatimonadales bacterium]